MTETNFITPRKKRRPQEGANVVERTGHRYGRLVVLKRAGSRGSSATWLCLCDCGNQKVISSNCLRAGYSRSCGCSRATGKGSRPNYRCNMPPGESARNIVLKGYRQAAKSRGLEWGLSRNEFFKLTNANCHYCGIEPSTISAPSKNGQWVYNGVDRIDNALGYIIGNVFPCCPICNHAKHTMSIESFSSWVARLVHHNRKCGPIERALTEPVHH